MSPSSSSVMMELLALDCEVDSLDCDVALDCEVDGLECDSDVALDCKVEALDCDMEALDCVVEGLDCEVEGLDCEVEGLDCDMETLDCEVEGLDCGVDGLGCEVVIWLSASSSPSNFSVSPLADISRHQTCLQVSPHFPSHFLLALWLVIHPKFPDKSYSIVPPLFLVHSFDQSQQLCDSAGVPF